MYSVVFTLIGDPALTLHTPTVDLAPATGSGQTRLVLQGAGAAGDSVYCETVQTDSVLLDPFLHPANDGFKGRRFERETVFGRTHGVLGPGGSVSLDLPNIPDPRAGSVKVLTWNSKGMRYGHFPLSDLGPIAVRKTPGATAAKPAYRLVLQGTAVRVEWTRPGPRGNLRKTFDLRGSRR
jgi:hypothetical protein